ncbi:integrase core domain-containing protein, partial [Mizugakiibacter sediminis]|uniref:integrase core domain-containing protein n=1 Tax=Mizugakiibacter sediminis TaxID=1475481 RepID=UPI000A9DEEC0
ARCENRGYTVRLTDPHRFESQQHASRVIADWIQFYNHRRQHQALGMKTPAEAYALAASSSKYREY